jgi:cell division protein FtsA
LIGGIVLTGGGAQLKHIAQLTEFKTGLDTRIGYPNEYLAKDVPQEMASPMYATGIGLVIVGIDRYEREKEKLQLFVEEPEPELVLTEGKPKRVKEKKIKMKALAGDGDDAKQSMKFTETFIERIRNWFEEGNE